MQKAYDQHFERKKKQRMIQFLNINSDENLESLSKLNVVQLESQLNEEQKFDLQAFINKHKSDYLARILDQINIQNSDYYTNLASEYEIMLETLEANKNEPKEVQMNIQLKPSSENPDL